MSCMSKESVLHASRAFLRKNYCFYFTLNCDLRDAKFSTGKESLYRLYKFVFVSIKCYFRCVIIIYLPFPNFVLLK